MFKLMRGLGALLACLTLTACFVSKAPLIPAERSVKLMGDKGRVTAEVIGAGKDANDKPQVFDFRWTGMHYALVNRNAEGGVREGDWAFADMSQGYFLIQMVKGGQPDEPVEYHLVKRGANGNLDLSFAQCEKLTDAERRSLRLEMHGQEKTCDMTSFAQAEGAMKALIKTLTGPNARLLITPR